MTHAAPFHLLADSRTARRCASAAPARATRGIARRRSPARSPRPPSDPERPKAVSLGLPRCASGCDAHRARSAPRLWAVVGATGTGKTALSLDLAEALAGARAVRRDRQRRRDAAVPRHGHRHGEASARRAARHPASPARCARGHRRGRRRLVPGCRARRDRRASTIADAMRSSSAARVCTSRACCSTSASRRTTTHCAPSSRPSSTAHGPGVLFARLRDADPATAARIDPQNGRRIVRALEVLAQGAATHGAALPDEPVPVARRHAHHRGGGPARGAGRRASTRASRRMWADGLLDEVEALRARGSKAA